MHTLVAAYLGYEPPRPTQRIVEVTANDDLAGLLASVPARAGQLVDSSAWDAAARPAPAS